MADLHAREWLLRKVLGKRYSHVLDLTSPPKPVIESSNDEENDLAGVAVFIDLDNLGIEMRNQNHSLSPETIIKNVTDEFGTVAIAKIFCDFGRSVWAQSIDQRADACGFELIHCPKRQGKGELKDQVDFKIISHVERTLETNPAITTFVFGSLDGDYQTVIHDLKKKGKRVGVLFGILPGMLANSVEDAVSAMPKIFDAIGAMKNFGLTLETTEDIERIAKEYPAFIEALEEVVLLTQPMIPERGARLTTLRHYVWNNGTKIRVEMVKNDLKKVFSVLVEANVFTAISHGPSEAYSINHQNALVRRALSQI